MKLLCFSDSGGIRIAYTQSSLPDLKDDQSIVEFSVAEAKLSVTGPTLSQFIRHIQDFCR